MRTCLLPLVLSLATVAGAQFRVAPYLQDPAVDGMTLVWLTPDATPGEADVRDSAAGPVIDRQASIPERAEALGYQPWEAQRFFAGDAPAPPFVHRVRFTGLQAGRSYRYAVRQGTARAEGSFTTAPPPGTPVRLVFFADCETEPESTGSRVGWADPTGADGGRVYLLDQTTGFARNLRVILGRQPDVIAIAGDLVESGGEQRDWDEFWRHLTDVDGVNLAGRIPILAAPGNHEYYEGPSLGRYEQPGSERATAKFRTYFSFPDNGSVDARGRYYRVDYGAVTLIALDVTNGSPNRSAGDTNFMLLGRSDGLDGGSPGFGPGTEQYAWLEAQLSAAQQASAFTFVFFHHVPYSVGPHGWPPGDGDSLDTQSGVPVRALTPLFLRYGVDAVIAGHDEIWERSEVDGQEVLPGGRTRPHTLQVLDVGIAGDGLRGPQDGLVNPYQQFLVHDDAPEVWVDGTLQSGGKHYGHLEVDVEPTADGGWEAVLKPVHVFPLLDPDGGLRGVDRRLYDDVVTLRAAPRTTAVAGTQAAAGGFDLAEPFPNPFNSSVELRFRLDRQSRVRLDVFDVAGRRVRRLLDEARPAGDHSVTWDARDARGVAVASGVYLFELRAGAQTDTVQAALVR